ncbi:hypothetical protein D3C71_1829160 [compost metagenome]
MLNCLCVIPKYYYWQIAINKHGLVISVAANIVPTLINHRESPAFKVKFLRDFSVGCGYIDDCLFYLQLNPALRQRNLVTATLIKFHHATIASLISSSTAS